eukprot:CAMPEP_0170377352 /NCGR_PEP_ID=MMETSP0117_2-20130122/12228_1 /TAXON_ID=400756 /ORGANISM="Durinskia baltica, Strain CSIRO CS-38" /LENGTH=529 /DNA_ID=CAMNT_0010632647 /DNA_START=310 /DNA_END=1896 /DNA_ORIENTATION=+
MKEIENYIPNSHLGERLEVIHEIILDCRKKTAQLFRAPLAETVQNVVAALRKRLVAKTALISESPYMHNQRHLFVLIELLGSWSNIVFLCCRYGFSRPINKLILSPIYERVVEAALECFKTFKRDKELDQWISRLLDDNSFCNVASLDSIVAQIASMKALVHQHYVFHYNVFHEDIDNYSPLDGVARGTLGSMLVVTQEELLQWRELDTLYVAMEFGFLQRATQHALLEVQLLEVEANVIIPQSIEDYFYVLVKACKRALATGSESNVFSVGSRIIELVRSSCSRYDGSSVLYQLSISKEYFRKCAVRREVSRNYVQRIMEEFGGVKTACPTTPYSGFSGTSGEIYTNMVDSAHGGTTSSKWSISPAQDFPNVFDTAASVISFSGVQFWFADQLSPLLDTTGVDSSANSKNEFVNYDMSNVEHDVPKSKNVYLSPPPSTHCVDMEFKQTKSASTQKVRDINIISGMNDSDDKDDIFSDIGSIVCFSEVGINAKPWGFTKWDDNTLSEYYEFYSYLDSEYRQLPLAEADW